MTREQMLCILTAISYANPNVFGLAFAFEEALKVEKYVNEELYQENYNDLTIEP